MVEKFSKRHWAGMPMVPALVIMMSEDLRGETVCRDQSSRMEKLAGAQTTLTAPPQAQTVNPCSADVAPSSAGENFYISRGAALKKRNSTVISAVKDE